MYIDPIIGQAFQARDLVTDFVIQNFRAPARNGIEPGVAQTRNGVANRQAAVFGDSDDLGG